MRKITLFFITMLTLSFASFGQCNYSIELRDSFGDGYNATTVDVFVNGGLVLDDITIADGDGTPYPGGDSQTFIIPASDSNDITVVTNVTGENFPDEVSYVIFDALGGLEGLGSYNVGTTTFEDTSAISVTCPPCDVPLVTYTLISNCPVDTGFSIDVTVTDIGVASGVIITDDKGTAASGSLGVGTHNYGSYIQGDDVVITVTNADNAICVTNSSSLTSVNACPPSNDDCGTAELLIPSAIGSEVWTTSTTLGNTPAGEVTGTSCTSAFNFGAGRDTWFRVEVPTSQEIAIETQAEPGSNLSDTIITVYSGSCGSLTEIGCDDDTTGLFSTVSLTNAADGIIAGEFLLIRVYRYANGINDDTDEDGEFQISAYAANPALLSTEDFDNNPIAVSYFPNPVNDKLTLKAQQNIQNVSVFNMLGQEVMRTEMNTQRGELDMSSLQSGAYFVKVTVNNTVETIKIIKK